MTHYSHCAHFWECFSILLDAYYDPNWPTFNITQANFTPGTLRIVERGKYVLQENITFDPNPPDPANTTSKNGVRFEPYDAYHPTAEQMADGTYPAPLYTLGFFAAITVETSGVKIDLNGFAIEQSVGHALMQPFFAVIELANAPFITAQGK